MLLLATDFPARAGKLSGPVLRELVRPWLQDAVVNKEHRTVTLTIRRVPAADSFAFERPAGGQPVKSKKAGCISAGHFDYRRIVGANGRGWLSCESVPKAPTKAIRASQVFP
jgi:hypothetical protein